MRVNQNYRLPKENCIGNFTALGTSVLPLFDGTRPEHPPVASAGARGEDIVAGVLWSRPALEIREIRTLANRGDRAKLR